MLSNIHIKLWHILSPFFIGRHSFLFFPPFFSKFCFSAANNGDHFLSEIDELDVMDVRKVNYHFIRDDISKKAQM